MQFKPLLFKGQPYSKMGTLPMSVCNKCFCDFLCSHVGDFVSDLLQFLYYTTDLKGFGESFHTNLYFIIKNYTSFKRKIANCKTKQNKKYLSNCYFPLKKKKRYTDLSTGHGWRFWV